MFEVIPGNPIEFAQLPSGAIFNLLNLKGEEKQLENLLLVKVASQRCVALLPRDFESRCGYDEMFLDMPKGLVVQRYWIEGECEFLQSISPGSCDRP